MMPRTCALPIVLLVCILFVVPARLHAADTITLDQAVNIALQKNPSLAASRSGVNIAQHKVTQARAAYYPQVSASAGYERTGTHSGSGKSKTDSTVDDISTGISVTQYLYDFGKTPAQVEKSRRDREYAEKGLETVEKTLIRDVKQAFFEVLKHQQLVLVGRESVTVRKQQLEQARALYGAGMRPKIDITRAEVETSQAQLTLVTAEQGLQESIIVFERLLGGRPVPGDYTLAEVYPSATVTPHLEELIETAADTRPEIAALTAQIRAAEADLTSVKQSAFPNLSASGSYNYSGDDLSLEDHRWQVGVSLNWPLFTGFRQSGQVLESREAVNRLHAQLDSLRLQVTEEVTRAYVQLQTARETIKNAETALTQAEENLALARGRYAAGVSDSIELSDAQVLYTESRSELVQARYDSHKARAGLECAVGEDISG